MTILEPSKRRPLRIQIKNCIVAFTKHAVRRMHERNITPEELIDRMRGRRFRNYRHCGVVAKRGCNVITVITAWNPEP